DFDFHKAECEQAHIRQTGLKPSAQTLRGHQCPGAFMIMASRLDEHGCDSDHPLKFTHIDMGSAAGEHPETSFPKSARHLSCRFDSAETSMSWTGFKVAILPHSFKNNL
ncbi:hypothetical protein OSTOST_25108, partial [Ostertagia ostertagi]